MSAPTVSLVDVTYRYGDRTVLDIDRLVVSPGATAVLGPNGAGKSTMLRLLATLASPATGSVTVAGGDLADPAQRLAVRRRLGYAGQLDQLPGRMRVREFCDYVAALKEIGPRRRRIRWTGHVLGAVGLSEQAGDRIGSLSGGMRRRLVLAQALLGRPDLLVLDEPLVSLDSEHRAQVVRLVAESAEQRTTIIATHHTDEIAAVCDQVVVLVGGRVAYAGSPVELAGRAAGRTWETSAAVDHPSARAVAPGRYRVVGWQPAGGSGVDPTVHDGYLAVLNAAAFPAP